MPDLERQSRAAGNRSLCRNANERIAELNAVFDRLVGMGEWVCECADAFCIQPLRLTLHEYEAVRSRPEAFLVAPGHVDPLVEHILEETDRYVVVEMVEVGAEHARAGNPVLRSNAA